MSEMTAGIIPRECGECHIRWLGRLKEACPSYLCPTNAPLDAPDVARSKQDTCMSTADVLVARIAALESALRDVVALVHPRSYLTADEQTKLAMARSVLDGRQ